MSPRGHFKSHFSPLWTISAQDCTLPLIPHVRQEARRLLQAMMLFLGAAWESVGRLYKLISNLFISSFQCDIIIASDTTVLLLRKIILESWCIFFIRFTLWARLLGEFAARLIWTKRNLQRQRCLLNAGRKKHWSNLQTENGIMEIWRGPMSPQCHPPPRNSSPYQQIMNYHQPTKALLRPCFVGWHCGGYPKIPMRPSTDRSFQEAATMHPSGFLTTKDC